MRDEPTETDWEIYHGTHAGVRLLQGIALVLALVTLLLGDGGRALALIVGVFLLNFALPRPPR